MQTYEYIGEGELVMPFTLDGPRVIEKGDSVNVPDDDESFKDHPLFVKVGSPAPTPAPTPAPAPVPEPASEPDPAAEPDPAPVEPTA